MPESNQHSIQELGNILLAAVEGNDEAELAVHALVEQLREEQRAFRAYKEHVMRTVEAFVEDVRP